MRTENVAEIVPRLEALRAATGDAVCLHFNLWLHDSTANRAPVAEWSIWVAAKKDFYEGDTLADALKVAEHACLPEHAPKPAPIPDALVTP